MKFLRVIKPMVDSLIAGIIGLLGGAIIMALWGYPPLAAYTALFSSVFGDVYGVASTLARATPLILTGLTFAIGVRGGVFNIGAEGQLYFGAMAAVAVSLVQLPPGLHLALAMVAGMLAGALWSLPAALLKITRGVHEVISTIMLNWIAFYLGMYLVVSFLGDPQRAEKSISAAPTSRFPVLFRGTSLTYGFIASLIFALIVFIILWRTTIGFEVRVVGQNPDAAQYAGIDETSSVVTTFILGGLAAGLAGTLQIVAHPPTYALYSDFSTLKDLGFDGIGVALIGRNHPIGAIFAALFFAGLTVGARTMQISAGVPLEMVKVIQGLIILALAAPEIFNLLQLLKGQLTAWLRKVRSTA
ncbi:MAG: ABC transporter permease [Candidatus Bipolaricaulota bacterium]